MTPVDRSELPRAGPAPSFRFPLILKRPLANGLAVWTVEHPNAPVVTFLLLVPAGSAADPSDRPGLASLTADLLDEGSGARSALEMHEALARIGARFDIDVGVDASVLTLTTLTRFRERGAELLADMVTRPCLEPAELARVRELRLNRLIQLRNQPSAVADRIFTELLYRDHPYGHLGIGTERSLRGITHEEVMAFHRAAFVPRGSTLIAVGDAPHEELARAVSETFAEWSTEHETQSPGAISISPDAALTPPPEIPPARLAVLHRPGAAQSELRIGHVAVSRNTPEYHALLTLNMVLGGQFISRLNLNLREEKGYTYGARTMFDFRRGRGPFVFQASVETDVTAAAIREVFAELDGIRGARPATDHELDTARAALTRGYPRSFETAEQVARAAAQLALYDLPDDDFSRFVERVSAVGTDEVHRAASTSIDPSRALTVIVGDRDKVAPTLESLGLGAPLDQAVTA